MTTATTTKTCRRCSESQPASGFSADARNRDGLRSFCRSCRAAQEREKRRLTHGVTRSATDSPPSTSGDATAGSRDDAADLSRWPEPLDPAKYPAALVERREKVIAIYAALNARVAQRGGGA